MRVIVTLVFSLVTILSMAQTLTDTTKSGHKIYVTWGYNRAFYLPSDIHFEGKGFDFTLYNVIARDIPEPFDTKIYIHPTKLTIPQYNFRAGYFLNDKVAVSFGWDHMKYKLHPNQVVKISGYMHGAEFGAYEGDYDDENIQLVPGFLRYEHSDGFNFIRAGLERYETIWISKNKKLKGILYGGVSAGAMLPWTDFHFVGETYRNWLHFAGWGVSVLAGGRFEFLDYFFFQVQAQHGFSQLGDIIIQDGSSARADQSIVFLERSWSMGGIIPLGNKK